jgi:DNA-binding winged helix-turn-helix (wHTH) protein
MNVAVVRNHAVEWHRLPGDEPSVRVSTEVKRSGIERSEPCEATYLQQGLQGHGEVLARSRLSDSLLSCLQANPVQAVLFSYAHDALERACVIRQDESFKDLPIVLLAHDLFPARRKTQEDLRQQLSSLLNGQTEGQDTSRRLHVDRRAREIWLERTYHSCSPMEFRLLLFFLQYPRIVFCREELVRRVRVGKGQVDTRIIDVLIRRLRRKIEVRAQSPRNLRTVPKLGYLFDYQGDTFMDVETKTPVPCWASYQL